MVRKNSLLFYVALLAVLLMTSACGLTGATGPQTDPARTLSVTGNAQVLLTPDIAYVSVGVHTDGADATEAVNRNNEMAQQLMSALAGLGIAATDMRTTGFSIYPQQQYDQAGALAGTRYMVDNTVYITLRDLSRVGDVLGAAVGAGANNIYGVQFDVADKTAALAQARTQAIQNARSQAEELAAAAGVTLGEVQAINFYNSYPGPMVTLDNKVVNGVGGGGVPISAGQLTISVDVNVIYVIQ